MPTKSLFSISEEMQAFITLLEEDELTPEIEEQLAITQQELEQKALNYIKLIATTGANEQLAEDTIKHAQQYLKQQQRIKARLKASLLEAAKKFGKIKCGMHTISIGTSEQVEIIDLEQLPTCYKPFPKLQRVPDKKAIKDAIKAGVEIPGAVIKPNEYLRIS